MMNVNTDKVVELFGIILHDYWEELQEKYKFAVPFRIISSISKLSNDIDDDNVNLDEANEDELRLYCKYVIRSIKSKKIDRFGGALMSTNWSAIISKTDNSVEFTIPSVTMDIDALTNSLLVNINQLDVLFEYFKTAMLHEVGHILHMTEIFGPCKNEHEFTELMKLENSNCEDIMNKLADGNLSKEDSIMYYKKYFTDIPAEKHANDRVGLTYEIIHKAEDRVVPQYDEHNKIISEFPFVEIPKKSMDNVIARLDSAVKKQQAIKDEQKEQERIESK